MKGQTLIETILAVSVIGIIVSGISVLIVSALSNANFAKNQSLATEYAQEGVEVLRSIRNKNYTTFAAYSNTAGNSYCLAKPFPSVLPSETTTCTVNVDSSFKRSVRIEQNGCDTSISRATITVSWTDGKCATGTFCHKSQLVSCLSTVNPIPTP